MRRHGPLIVIAAGVALAAFLMVGLVRAASGGEPELGDAIVVSPSSTGSARSEETASASPKPSATPRASRSQAQPVKPPPPRQGGDDDDGDDGDDGDDDSGDDDGDDG